MNDLVNPNKKHSPTFGNTPNKILTIKQKELKKKEKIIELANSLDYPEILKQIRELKDAKTKIQNKIDVLIIERNNLENLLTTQKRILTTKNKLGGA